MRTTGAVFCQSAGDFPCLVSLGKVPSFGLCRYNQGLRFIVPESECYSLRGDKRRLVYRGRKQSHRFTVLGDTAFEYDCILHKEPETNVITLHMEGAENYDFLRQPVFVHEPFLKGSYAVYKKDTLAGQGTGKLCHICRPEIIDALGRRCWGELSIVDNDLRITLPEGWLGNAKYPVIVDPTVGTATVGSQYRHIWEVGEPAEELMFELRVPVNRFAVTETINGTCTAYAYVNSSYLDAGGRPVVYSDNGGKPQSRLSMQEGKLDLKVNASKPAGWRSAVFNSNGSIASGGYIWFGIFCEDYWMPRFDYGLKCFMDSWDDYGDIPSTYPLFNVNWYENFKLSMYFTYTAAQNYARKLTQGVKLSDSRKMKVDYSRIMAQKAGANSLFGRFADYFRKSAMAVPCGMSVRRSPLFSRNVKDSITVFSFLNYLLSLARKCVETVTADSGAGRKHSAFRALNDGVKGADVKFASILFCRTVPETAYAGTAVRQWGAFFRGLHGDAENLDEIKRRVEYFRSHGDVVQAVGAVFRGLLLFIKIIAGVFARNWIVARFLIAREFLVLKSPVCREIILESRIG